MEKYQRVGSGKVLGSEERGGVSAGERIDVREWGEER